MKEKLLYSRYPVTWAVVFEKGDEFSEGIRRFAKQHNLSASRITGIGSFSDVVFGWFDREKRDFKKITLSEQVEVLSLLGDISRENGEPRVHVHCVVGRSDGSAHGGHVFEAHVWPTLEVIITEVPSYLRPAA